MEVSGSGWVVGNGRSHLLWRCGRRWHCEGGAVQFLGVDALIDIVGRGAKGACAAPGGHDAGLSEEGGVSTGEGSGIRTHGVPTWGYLPLVGLLSPPHPSAFPPMLPSSLVSGMLRPWTVTHTLSSSPMIPGRICLTFQT